MQCPDNFETYELDEFHINHLICTKCQNGCILYENKGQCFCSCINNYGYLINKGKHEKGEDPNCIDCSLDTKICRQDALFEDKCTCTLQQ